MAVPLPAGIDPGIAALAAAAPAAYEPRKLTVATARGPLRPWMHAYARELVLAQTRLTPDEKRATISALARVKPENVSVRFLKTLEARADFREVLAAYAVDPTLAVRQHIEHQLAPTAARVYLKALEEQERRLAPEVAGAADLRQVPTLVAPALDRVAPKKAEGGSAAAVQVNIQLSPQRASRLDEPPITVEAVEVVDDSHAP